MLRTGFRQPTLLIVSCIFSLPQSGKVLYVSSESAVSLTMKWLSYFVGSVSVIERLPIFPSVETPASDESWPAITTNTSFLQ